MCRRFDGSVSALVRITQYPHGLCSCVFGAWYSVLCEGPDVNKQKLVCIFHHLIHEALTQHDTCPQALLIYAAHPYTSNNNTLLGE